MLVNNAGVLLSERSSLPQFCKATNRLLRTPDGGADMIVWLGAASEAARSSGDFWHDRVRRPSHRVPWTKETPAGRERLWAECERISGWRDTRIPTIARSNR